MPGPVLDVMLAQLKQSDIENFDKKMVEKETEHEKKVRPEEFVTISELMRRRAEQMELDDFIGIPTSSEEVEQKKRETAAQPVDSGSNEIMRDFLNKLKG